MKDSIPLFCTAVNRQRAAKRAGQGAAKKKSHHFAPGCIGYTTKQNTDAQAARRPPQLGQKRRLLEKIKFFPKKVLTFRLAHSIIVYVVRTPASKKPCFDRWEFSSAGRASALQAEGHRFEPCNSHQYGLVVQLVRTLACHARGRGFEPHPGRQPIFRLCLCSSVGRAED